MVNFKRILFPVEFTPQCQIAARHIAAYARHFDAEVILLHVECLALRAVRLGTSDRSVESSDLISFLWTNSPD